MTAKCAVCGGDATIDSGLRDDLVECRGCGLIYRPGATEDRAEFGERYFVEGAYSDYVAEREAIRGSAARRLRALERMVRGRRLLDVGCAAGYFLEAAKNRGWEPSGLELSPYAAARARTQALDVHEGSILAPPDVAPFDVITMWDTIEHLSEPGLALDNARRLLRPGGIIVISTGDRRSAVARLLGRRWRLLGDQTHKFFFDEATLSTLLINAGLRPIASNHAGKWVGLGMVLYQLGIPGASQVRRAIAATGWNPSIYVNLWDVITMVAGAAPS